MFTSCMHWRDQSHHLKYHLLLKTKEDVRKGKIGFSTKAHQGFYRYSHPALPGTEREMPLQIKISLINVIALTKG